jgi:hypothetical protein
MSMPWFLELLALPPHADERAVRRAYAVRLKSIDPATDPAGFARLREAYEAARAWAADEDHEVLTDLSPSRPVDAEETPAQPVVMTVNPQEQAASLVDRFAERIARGFRGDVRRELEACTAELRLQYIDAPGIFEEVLIDRLARGLIEKRAAVFTHASDHFHWQEIGHVASLGPKGMWIDAVESQRMAWISLAAVPGRANRLSMIERADATRGILPTEIVRRWIEVRDDFQRFPAYLGLYLAPLRQLEWAACYNALPAHERQALEAPARKRRWRLPGRESVVRAWGFFFIAMAAGIVYLLESAATIGPSPSTLGPVVASSAASLGRESGLDVILSEPSDPARQGKGWIVVTLTNHGSAPLYLDRTHTPPMTTADRLAWPLFTVTDLHGAPVTFVRQNAPVGTTDAAGSFLPLEAGRTLSNTIDLGTVYKLGPRRSYMVSYRQPVTRTSSAYAQGTIPEDPAYVDSNSLFIIVNGNDDATSR